MKRSKTSAFSQTAPRRLLAEAAQADDDFACADMVRDSYVLERSQWESRKAGRAVAYLPPRAYAGKPAVTVEGDSEAVLEPARRSEWLQLALRLRGLDIDAEAYIQLQFTLLPTTESRAPEPRQLTADKYLQRWHDNKYKTVELLRVELSLQRSLAEREFSARRAPGESAEDAWACVLVMCNVELSPLFRYCLASHLGGKRFANLAAKLEARAILQFMRHRDLYQQIWGTLIPRSFPAYAQEQFPGLLTDSMRPS